MCTVRGGGSENLSVRVFLWNDRIDNKMTPTQRILFASEKEETPAQATISNNLFSIQKRISLGKLIAHTLVQSQNLKVSYKVESITQCTVAYYTSDTQNVRNQVLYKNEECI